MDSVDDSWDLDEPAATKVASVAPQPVASAQVSPVGPSPSASPKPVNPSKFPSAMKVLAKSDPAMLAAPVAPVSPAPASPAPSTSAPAAAKAGRADSSRKFPAARPDATSAGRFTSPIGKASAPSTPPATPAPDGKSRDGSSSQPQLALPALATKAAVASSSASQVLTEPSAPAEVVKPGSTDTGNVAPKGSTLGLSSPPQGKSQEDRLEGAPIQPIEQVNPPQAGSAPGDTAAALPTQVPTQVPTGHAVPVVESAATSTQAHGDHEVVKPTLTDSPSARMLAARGPQESLLSLETSYAVDFFSSAPPPVHHMVEPTMQFELEELPSRSRSALPPEVQLERLRYFRTIVVRVMLVALVLFVFALYVLWHRGAFS